MKEPMKGSPICERCGLRVVRHELEQQEIVMHFCDDCYWGLQVEEASPSPREITGPSRRGVGDHLKHHRRCLNPWSVRRLPVSTMGTHSGWWCQWRPQFARGVWKRVSDQVDRPNVSRIGSAPDTSGQGRPL